MLTLIIAVYKNTEALKLILTCLRLQSFKNFEIIIAEDNNSPLMAQCIAELQTLHNFKIKHVSQPDQGFRKCKALNAAIKVADSDYLVFIDGDCLLHKHFLRAHFINKEKNTMLWARRVMLSPLLSHKIYSDQNLEILNYINLFRWGAKRLDCALYLPVLPTPIDTRSHIWGCNWSIFKADIEKVNGFDEDYTAAGIGEDTDIEWRLIQNGAQLKKIKNQAIQYHLHHTENYILTQANEALMNTKQKIGRVFCVNGLIKR